VTICANQRSCIFSRISVGAIHESPAIELTAIGRLVEKTIRELPDRYGIHVDRSVIMPNHVHLLVRWDAPAGERALREAPLQKRSQLSKMVGYLKMNVTKAAHVLYGYEKIWQRSYHDHVIRDEADYLKIWNYIDTNPAKWEKDCFFTK
jgi:REP element-mobilizing transposase RayT